MDPKEKEKNETPKEVTPEWATKLQNSLDSLPDRLSEILKPKDPDPTPDPETEDPSKPQEIPVPEIPKPETPEPEPLTDPEPETPKKKKFLDWLL